MTEWQRFELSDLLQILPSGKQLQQGKSPQCAKESAGGEQWGVLKTTAIQSGHFEPQHNKRLPDHLAPDSKIEVQVRDLLLTCAGPRSRCGIPTLVRSTPPRRLLSGKMYRFRADEEKILPEFLELFLLSDQAQDQIDGMKTGISDSGLNLTQGRFLRLTVPLPPIVEQRRIVATLDDHLSRLDAADAALGRVAARCQTLGRSQLNQVLRDNDWDCVALGDLATSASYGTSTKCAVTGTGQAVVRIPNLVDGAIDLTDRKSAVDPSTDLTKYMLQEGDLLFVRTNGSRDLIGRTAVVGVPVDAAFASYLIRFQLDLSQVRPRWVSLMTRSTAVRRAIEDGAASSAGQYNLNLKTLKRLAIPLPPNAVQDEYLGNFANLSDEITRARLAAEAGCHRSASMKRSLLHAAFSGDI